MDFIRKFDEYSVFFCRFIKISSIFWQLEMSHSTVIFTYMVNKCDKNVMLITMLLQNSFPFLLQFQKWCRQEGRKTPVTVDFVTWNPYEKCIANILIHVSIHAIFKRLVWCLYCITNHHRRCCCRRHRRCWPCIVVVTVTFLLFYLFSSFINKRQESPIKVDSTFFDSIKSIYASVSFFMRECVCECAIQLTLFHFTIHFEWIWFDACMCTMFRK